jgi:long-chain acyl-CoA synthetase
MSFLINSFYLLLKPLSRIYFKLKADGLENIPKDKPVIFVSNHQSALDGFLLNIVLKWKMRKKTYFFAKDKNFKTSIKKLFAKNSNILLLNINKNLKESLQNLATVLNKGKNIVIFPEGVRSRDGQIRNFKKTFAILSKELNIPIIPVAINGTFKSMSIGSKIPKPGKVNIKILQPLEPGGKNYQEISDEAKNIIDKNLK